MKAFMRIAGCVAAVWGCAAGAQEDHRPASTEPPAEDLAQPTEDLAQPAQADTPRKQPHMEKPSMGFYALVGGGVEGYAGQLSPRVGTGFTYGLSVGYFALPYVAVELGYNGSINNLDQNGKMATWTRTGRWRPGVTWAAARTWCATAASCSCSAWLPPGGSSPSR